MVAVQQKRLATKMLEVSKTDRMLFSGFRFDGKVKKYLEELNFDEARVIFLLRSRMFPTKLRKIILGDGVLSNVIFATVVRVINTCLQVVKGINYWDFSN